MEQLRRLQREVIDWEAKSLEFDCYSEEQVRQAIVHTRQDMVLLVGHLAHVNRRLNRITWLLAVAVVLAALAVFG